MIRVVFDTVVLVRGLLNPRNYCGRIVFPYAAEYHLIVSEPILHEVLEVLTRPRIAAKFRTLPGLDLRRVLDVLAGAEVVDVRTIPPVSRDAHDDKFLATAKVAGAAYLVSEDNDLLSIGSYEDVRIITCAEFLAVRGLGQG